MTWKADGESVLRGYKFSYDGLNRLTSSVYGEGTSIASNLNRYTENMTYDKMGNILSVKRYGKLSATSFGLIDDLSLTYFRNQLQKVSDAVTSTVTDSMNFIDDAEAEKEYNYDDNGNLTSDLNRRVRKIEYNPLNLPQKIFFSDGDSISYLYGADGKKLRTIYVIGGTSSRTDYPGNRIYADGRLDKILTEEGYININGSTPAYHYYLTDHLGNNRLVMNQDGSVEQVKHYYSFGGLMAESTGGDVQPWKFGGKELDTKKGVNWLDFGSRYYRSLLGRWSSVDPLAKKYCSWSPYSYCLNNPVKFVDPAGSRVKPFGEDELEMITNALTDEDKKYVALDKEGFIDPKLLNSDTSESGNFNALSELVNSDLTIDVKPDDKFIYKDKKGNMVVKDEMSYSGPDPEFADPLALETSGLSTGETGYMGMTLLPGKGKEWTKFS